MRISGYTSAANVKGKLLPYDACIKSMLNIADEVWVATDPRYDFVETFTSLDKRVNVVASEYKVENITGNGDQLSEARIKCQGDWLIWLDLDEILHEKDCPVITSLINYAETNGYDAISLAEYNYVNKTRTFSTTNYYEWFVRVKITKNIQGIRHGSPSSVFQKRENGELYIGNGDGADYIKDDAFFNFNRLNFIDYPFFERLSKNNITPVDILETVAKFPYIYHYARYSVIRKMKMMSHQRNEYFWGRSNHNQSKQWMEELGQEISLNKGEEIYLGNLIEVQPEHPAVALEWVAMIDELMGWKV